MLMKSVIQDDKEPLLLYREQKLLFMDSCFSSGLFL